MNSTFSHMNASLPGCASHKYLERKRPFRAHKPKQQTIKSFAKMRFAFALGLWVAALVLVFPCVDAAGGNRAQYDGLDLNLRLGPPSASSNRVFDEGTTSIAPDGDASSSRSSTVSDRSRSFDLNDPYHRTFSSVGSSQHPERAFQGQSAAVPAQEGGVGMPNDAVRRHVSGTWLQYRRGHFGKERLPIISSDGKLDPQGAMQFQERIRDLQATKK